MFRLICHSLIDSIIHSTSVVYKSSSMKVFHQGLFTVIVIVFCCFCQDTLAKKHSKHHKKHYEGRLFALKVLSLMIDHFLVHFADDEFKDYANQLPIDLNITTTTVTPTVSEGKLLF